MKKIDKLVLGAFIGPFLITFLVVVFILLNIQMLKYFDDIIGKGLDWTLVAQLFFYFGIFTTPTALPLAVLLSSLIAFGNLGEHFELTAVKAAGISLLRTLVPIFFFVVGLTALAFYANNYLVPKAALEAYSLLYDIKQKKPALDLREGTFYNGIPNISIKVDQKFEDGETMKNVIIYDHRKNDGNKEVTVADSGRMYTILNERYLKLELFDGYNYSEGIASESEAIGQRRSGRRETLRRSQFDKMQVVFDLSSFNLERTDKKWFQGNRIMRNLLELDVDLDSIRREETKQRLAYYQYSPAYFLYYKKSDSLIFPPDVYRYKLYRDSVARARYASEESDTSDAVSADTAVATLAKDTPAPANAQVRELPASAKRRLLTDSAGNRSVAGSRPSPLTPTPKKTVPGAPKKLPLPPVDTLSPAERQARLDRVVDSLLTTAPNRDIVMNAANMARQIKNQITSVTTEITRYEAEEIIFEIQWHKIIASSFACIAMFLIGAPLGAIIKKGGLGVPFLVSILFFIIFYVLTIQGEKFAKQENISVIVGVWMPDVVFLIIGVFFLRQARADARLFDLDAYKVGIDRLMTRIRARSRKPQLKSAS